MPELEQRADAVVFAERGAPGFEERLRGNHQDVHRVGGRRLRRRSPAASAIERL